MTSYPPTSLTSFVTAFVGLRKCQVEAHEGNKKRPVSGQCAEELSSANGKESNSLYHRLPFLIEGF
jgi:hypothetical protein